MSKKKKRVDASDEIETAQETLTKQELADIFEAEAPQAGKVLVIGFDDMQVIDQFLNFDQVYAIEQSQKGFAATATARASLAGKLVAFRGDPEQADRIYKGLSFDVIVITKPIKNTEKILELLEPIGKIYSLDEIDGLDSETIEIANLKFYFTEVKNG